MYADNYYRIGNTKPLELSGKEWENDRQSDHGGNEAEFYCSIFVASTET